MVIKRIIIKSFSLDLARAIINARCLYDFSPEKLIEVYKYECFLFEIYLKSKAFRLNRIKNAH